MDKKYLSCKCAKIEICARCEDVIDVGHKDQKTSTSVGAATNVSYPAHAARHSVFHVEGS